MVKLSELLDLREIKLNLDAKRKKDIVEEMVDLLFKAGKIKDPQKVQEDIIRREKMGTTGIGGGIALPHIMVDQPCETLMAFGRKKEGVKFDAIDEQPVHLIFLLVGPKQNARLHLELLCKLSRFLHDTQFKKALLEAKDEREIISIFRGKEEKES
jgi:fructose-specific phosphotransferase system IIA component